jgi:hypothetical protein
MVEQSQDSSASTASSTVVQPAGGVGSPDRTLRGVRGPPVQQEYEEASKGGAGAGVRGKHPAPSGMTRTQTMHKLVAGSSLSAIARDLGVHRSTVQETRDSLLSSGVIVRHGTGYAKGPAFAVETVGKKGAGSDRSPLANATAPWRMTDGLRTFEVLSSPTTHPSDMAGFGGTKLSGKARSDARKRQNHRFVWTFEGRTFSLLLYHEPGAVGHGWGLQLHKVSPAPFLSAVQRPGEDTETAWDRFTFTAVQAWAQATGVQVSQDPARVRRSRPVSLALPHLADDDVKIRSPGFDVDGTPELGTVEVRTEQLKAFLEAGPEAQAQAARQFEELHEWRERMESELAGTRAGLEDVRVVSGKAVSVLREVRAIVMNQADALVTIAQTEAASLTPLPKRVLSPDSGVDVS